MGGIRNLALQFIRKVDILVRLQFVLPILNVENAFIPSRIFEQTESPLVANNQKTG